MAYLFAWANRGVLKKDPYLTLKQHKAPEMTFYTLFFF